MQVVRCRELTGFVSFPPGRYALTGQEGIQEFLPEAVLEYLWDAIEDGILELGVGVAVQEYEYRDAQYFLTDFGYLVKVFGELIVEDDGTAIACFTVALDATAKLI